ncbi:MoxR family ATPase [Streptomyces axinellae]|uniref:MoxR family ATPase n=1 Tax=Streptomyces axinellae TaxID=552788 RepID=A0ABN3PYK4_9ACTN
MSVPDWFVFRGTAEPHDGIDRLPPPPPWRAFDGGPVHTRVPPLGTESTRRLGVNAHSGAGPAWRTEELELVNAALYLRRPLLVTGDPGAGKSTLAHALAHELGLGRVLRWPVVSRTTLRDGLYAYDAIARLQDSQLGRTHVPAPDPPPAPEPATDPASASHPGSAPDSGRDSGSAPDPAVDPDSERGPGRREEVSRIPSGGQSIGRYLRLGPLGTALLPYERPRVLLIDELDKSDIDLPNDLLNVLEEGEFTLPELERIADREPETQVLTDDGERAVVAGGRVQCRAFPLVVMTSNGERDFPAPLLRRCLHLDLPSPGNVRAGADRLAAMVHAHFGDEGVAEREELIRSFLTSSPGSLRAADQLLNAIYLTQQAATGQDTDRERLADLLMRPLDAGERGPR